MFNLNKREKTRLYLRTMAIEAFCKVGEQQRASSPGAQVWVRGGIGCGREGVVVRGLSYEVSYTCVRITESGTWASHRRSGHYRSVSSEQDGRLGPGCFSGCVIGSILRLLGR